MTAVHAVYTGSNLHALSPVASSAEYDRITFAAKAGATYRIVIDGYSGYDVGSFDVTLTLYARPSNDDFAHAAELSGEAFNRYGTNFGATREQGEPKHYGSGDASVWYRWEAPASASTNISLSTDDPTAGYGVYTGPNREALTQVVAGRGRTVFQAIAGETYWIAVGGDPLSADAGFNVILRQVESPSAPWDYPDESDAPRPAELSRQEEATPQHPQEPDQQAIAHGPQDPGNQAVTQRPDEREQDARPESHTDVPPAAKSPHKSLSLSASFARQGLAGFLRSGLHGTATCSRACSLKVVATIGRASATRTRRRVVQATTLRATSRGAAGEPATLHVRVPAATRNRLRREATLSLLVEVRARSADETAAVTRRMRIRR
jgi:hypothetical protein